MAPVNNVDETMFTYTPGVLSIEQNNYFYYYYNWSNFHRVNV